MYELADSLRTATRIQMRRSLLTACLLTLDEDLQETPVAIGLAADGEGATASSTALCSVRATLRAAARATPRTAAAWCSPARSIRTTERGPLRRGCCLGRGSCEAIILAAANTSNPRLLPVAIADAAQPAFMPDGRTLIFAGKNNPSAAYDLYTVATGGSALTRLTSDGASEPAPCANGSIVYVHDDQLYLRRPNGRMCRT